ncbi:hypothetical protein Tco_0265787 [Tanacetum coccineum]
MNENKRIMPTKVELTLEQSQQGVSDDVLNIRLILFSIHSDDGNPSSVNIKQYRGRLVLKEPEVQTSVLQPILAKSSRLPHAHTQALKVNHSTSRLLLLNKNVIGQKAQVYVKFNNSDNHELLYHQRSLKSD